MAWVVSEMRKYSRKTPKTPFLGWGKYAVRGKHTYATSPRLLRYRGCIAGALAGKKGTLKDIQEAFRAAAHACAAKASHVTE